MITFIEQVSEMTTGIIRSVLSVLVISTQCLETREERGGAPAKTT